MKKVFPQKIYYQIQNKLGEGLTSEVYLADRVDERAWTRQRVALKIIKSRKHVQILKKEFEKLNQVQSKYCVQIRAWENLPQGSALVLEYIEGLTLYELQQTSYLSEPLVREVVGQMSLGLDALHRQNIVHGDLNLKNVIVTPQGVVKLIDFGFHSSETESWVTPRFAAPSVLAGETTTEKSDRESLAKIEDFLLEDKVGGAQKILNEGSTCYSSPKTQGRYRRSLGKIVAQAMQKKGAGTQVIATGDRRAKTSGFGSVLIYLATFLCCLLFSTSIFQTPLFGAIEVVSPRWIGVSINQLPTEYSPIVNKKMRAGRYSLAWKSAQNKSQGDVLIQPGEIFRLKPNP